MTIAEPNEIARPRVADDVEPLWHVRLSAGMITMTLDELDAAFQQGYITEQTLVAREDESYLRPLGVVAGLFEQMQIEAPCSEAPRGRASDVTGVRPSVYTRCQLPGSAQPDSFTATLLERHGQREPSSAEEGISTWESSPVRWLRNTRSALRVTIRRGTSWFLALAQSERWALGGLLLALVAVPVCVSWQVHAASRNVLGNAPLSARPPVARAAPPASQQKSLVALGSAPAPAASIPSRAVWPSAELDVSIATGTPRHGLALADRRKAVLSEGTRRPARRARASRRRPSHE